MKHLVIYHANCTDGFGGGGHRNAAGFETDITTLMGWLK